MEVNEVNCDVIKVYSLVFQVDFVGEVIIVHIKKRRGIDENTTLFHHVQT